MMASLYACGDQPLHVACVHHLYGSSPRIFTIYQGDIVNSRFRHEKLSFYCLQPDLLDLLVRVYHTNPAELADN